MSHWLVFSFSFYRLFVTLLAIIFVCGCATAISGREQSIFVNTVPSGADVLDNGVFRGQTPIHLDLERSKRHTFMLERDGYLNRELKIGRSFNWYTLTNIAWGILVPIGLLVDYSTGALFQLKPQDNNIILEQRL